MDRIRVYCDRTECKYNESGACERQSQFVNLDYNAECEDFEEGEGMSDLIDRAEAIRIASGYCHWSNIAKELEKLPSVTPTKRIGHWIKSNLFLLSECSECGNKAFGYNGFDEVLTDFCPNCGARMDGDTE